MCNRFLSPSTVLPDGTCRDCGRPVEAGRARPAADAAGDDALPAMPWHFKALLGALAVYLGYRFTQMGEWIWRRL